LLLADTKVRHQRIGHLGKADLGEQFLGPAIDGVAVNHAKARGRMRQKNVLRDRHQRNQRQLLMDNDDTQRLGIIDVAKAPLLAVEDDAAFVVAEGIDAAENLHQG
jgi:hypothetical protein